MNGPGERRTTEFEQLLVELSNGSNEAASKLVEMYSSNILRAVRRSLPRVIRSKMDSVDIFQSVWISVLAKRNRLAQLDTPQRFVTYLAAAARLKVLEKYRHFTQAKAFDVRRELRISDLLDNTDERNPAARPKSVITDTRHPSGSEIAEAREAWVRLLSHCDDRDREVVELRLAGKSYEDIADSMQVSTRTVRRMLQKLLKTMVS